MYIMRQISMTLLPSTASSVIAYKNLVNEMNETKSEIGTTSPARRNVYHAAKHRDGLKNFVIDLLSLPSRIVLGVDRQAKNVPDYHKGYFTSDAPKPLPGLLQAGAMTMRGLGYIVGSIVGAVASIVGTFVGYTDRFLGDTVPPSFVAQSFNRTGTLVGAFPFAAAAWVLDIIPKIHRNLLNKMLS